MTKIKIRFRELTESWSMYCNALYYGFIALVESLWSLIRASFWFAALLCCYVVDIIMLTLIAVIGAIIDLCKR